MSQLNPDLEANLVTDRRYASHNTNDELLLIDSQPETTSAENIQDEARNQMEYSLTFNFLAIFVPGPKIIASIVVFLTGGLQCIGPKQVWLMCMLAHDILHFVIVTLRIQTIMDIARLNSGSSRGSQIYPDSQGIQLTSPVSQQPGQEGFLQSERSNNGGVTHAKVLKKRKLVTKLTSACTYFWMLLFIYWLELDTISETNACDTPEIDTLVVAYVIIGWIWLLHPLVLCLAGCVCLPVLLIVLCIFGKRDQTPATRNEILNLPVKSYTRDLPGNKECAICIVDYQEGDQIVQLECSDMHHFHEPCLKDWLKINGQCPICRARLGEKRATASDTTNDTRNTTLNDSQQEILRL